MLDLHSQNEATIEAHISAIHAKSDYRDMPRDVFGQEMRKLATGKDCAIDFDESFYLRANADVMQAVQAGRYLCGYVHYCLFGQTELRLWSSRRIGREFSVQPQVGEGLFEPIHAKRVTTYGPDLSGLPLAVQPTLLLLLPNLHEELFFAGYSEFFADMKSLFSRFSRIMVAVVSHEFQPELALRIDPRIEVLHLSKLGGLTERPHIIFNFDVETFHAAREIFKDLDRTIYYCQDFEAGFFPFGSHYVRGEQAVAHSRNIVLSSGLLMSFLARRNLLSGANTHVTAPVIKPIQVNRVKNKRLFFYFRPERFNTRNMPELVMALVEDFCRKHSGYEIFMCGTVQTTYSMTVHGTHVWVLSKLPKAKYESLLASCDAVVALIYSAHPGVIAFQAAASGIPTVTNTFEERDAAVLRAISDNIVPFDPVRDSLLEKLEQALTMPKGQPSFSSEVYERRSPESLLQYVTGVMKSARATERPGSSIVQKLTPPAGSATDSIGI